LLKYISNYTFGWADLVIEMVSSYFIYNNLIIKILSSKHPLHFKGVLMISVAAILWGVGYPFWKILGKKIDIFSLTSISFLLSSLLILITGRLSPRVLFYQFKKHPFIFVLLGLSAGVLGSGLFFYALFYIDAGVVAFLEKLQVISVLICARLFLGEVFPSNKIPLVIFTLVIALFITVPNPFSFDLETLNLLGVVAAIMSAVFYGANVIMYKLVGDSNITPQEVAFFRMFLGGLSAVPVFMIDQNAIDVVCNLNREDIITLVVLCFFSQVLAFNFFITGLQYTSSATAGFLELLTPIVAMAFSVAFFGEVVSYTQVIAIPIYLFCILYLTLPSRKLIT
jgi:drug/metabolite transporter (DMT)-like permease